MTDRSAFESLSNWGRWGPDDDRGTLNLIDSDAVLRGISAVRWGRVISLSRELVPGATLAPPAFVHHRSLYQQHAPSGALDSVEIAPHGFEITHIDALSHVYFEDFVYNGRNVEETITPGGIVFGDVAALSGGIVSRGILLDVARSRGVGHLAPTDTVTASDLDVAEALTDATVSAGDVLVLRTGIELQGREMRVSSAQRTGIDTSCLEWMHQRGVGAYAGDCIEALPLAAGVEMPLHRFGLAGMGLVLIDAPLLEPLAAVCQELVQSTFLFVCAPLPIRGASGSAVNPLAIL
jgi:kynurenine formamidase